MVVGGAILSPVCLIMELLDKGDWIMALNQFAAKVLTISGKKSALGWISQRTVLPLSTIPQRCCGILKRISLK